MALYGHEKGYKFDLNFDSMHFSSQMNIGQILHIVMFSVNFQHET